MGRVAPRLPTIAVVSCNKHIYLLSFAMSITAFFRTLSSRSHWAIHSVWLVVLAGVLCVNVVDGYFQLQENELRRLLSESSIAVNIVKMEVGGITHLLDTV